MAFKNSKFKLTTTVGKRKKILGTFSRVSSVNKILVRSRELRKTFPFKERATISIQTMRNNRKVGNLIIRKI